MPKLLLRTAAWLPAQSFVAARTFIVVDLQQAFSSIQFKRRSATQCSPVDPGSVPAGGRKQTTVCW
jgi:hypothetical protein